MLTNKYIVYHTSPPIYQPNITGELMSISLEKTRVVHILSGDRWAGAEVQAFTLLTHLQAHTELHVIVMNNGELAKRCQSTAIATTILDESSMSCVQLFNAIRRQLDKLKPAIVHTHRLKENILGSLANLVTCRAKCLRTAHGAPEFIPSGKQKLQVWLDKLCGRYFQDAIIAVSGDLENTLANAFPRRKLRVITNGIDPQAIKAEITTPDFKRNAANAMHIGLVGRLDPVKRVDIFLEMAAILLRETPGIPWRFHIFGEGRQADSLQQLARELGIAEQVEFHGHRVDIRNCIAGLDAVVMPSDHEGLPMAALETLALGVRLVAHDIGGLTELLKNNKDYLVSKHNARAYAKVLTDVTLREKSVVPLNADYLASTNSEKVSSLYRELLVPPVNAISPHGSF
jgi:L-malate glycosyltransferase